MLSPVNNINRVANTIRELSWQFHPLNNSIFHQIFCELEGTAYNNASGSQIEKTGRANAKYYRRQT
tara:strand:- start:1090 stop:1287 length:198 start_codon:yes stop_codon:yes gene_type:complete